MPTCEADVLISRPLFVMLQRALCVLLLVGAGACKKSDGPVVKVRERDAAAAGDEAGDGAGGSGSNKPDAGGSGLDGSVIDGSIIGYDAGDEDAGPDPNTIDPTHACDIANENTTLALPTPSADEGGFALTIGTIGFGIAYQAVGCGGSIAGLSVTTVGPFKKPQALVDDCQIIHDVSLLHVSDGWRMAWVDNSSGSAELQTMSLSAALTAPASTAHTQVTNNGLREFRPLLASIGSAGYLAWLSEDTETHSRELDLKRLDDSGPVTVALAAELGKKPASFAFAQLGRERSAIAFVQEESPGGIFLLPLDKNAKPASEPVLLSDAVSPASTVDLATREEDGGAVVYSIDIQNVKPEVRFRRLSEQGTFLGEEVRIIGGGLQGRDASLARIGGGYAIAYRAVSSDPAVKSSVRLLFVTKEGNVTHDSTGTLLTYLVAEADPNGGRVTVRVSPDGQLLIAYLDTIDGVTQLKIVRKRLDCEL